MGSCDCRRRGGSAPVPRDVRGGQGGCGCEELMSPDVPPIEVGVGGMGLILWWEGVSCEFGIFQKIKSYAEL